MDTLVFTGNTPEKVVGWPSPHYPVGTWAYVPQRDQTELAWAVVKLTATGHKIWYYSGVDWVPAKHKMQALLHG